jgi:uncharacterized protein YlaI
MLNEITSAVSSLKIAYEIVKGFNSVKLETAMKEKSTELLDIIISLQQSFFSLHAEYEKIYNSKNEIEKEFLHLKEWERTKEKYILKEVVPDVLAYVHKKQEDSVGEKHWLCANCFNIEQKESIYQIKRRGNIPSHIYYCPQCKNEILVKNANYQSPEPVKVTRTGNSWVTRY